MQVEPLLDASRRVAVESRRDAQALLDGGHAWWIVKRVAVQSGVLVAAVGGLAVLLGDGLILVTGPGAYQFWKMMGFSVASSIVPLTLMEYRELRETARRSPEETAAHLTKTWDRVAGRGAWLRASLVGAAGAGLTLLGASLLGFGELSGGESAAVFGGWQLAVHLGRWWARRSHPLADQILSLSQPRGS